MTPGRTLRSFVLQRNRHFLEEVEKLVPDKDESMIVGCQIGLRGAPAALELMNARYRRVVSLQDGLNAWIAAGLPYIK